MQCSLIKGAFREKGMSNTTTESLSTRIGQLLSLARTEWLMLTVGTVMLIIGIAMTLLYPQLFRVIIDDAIINKKLVTLDYTTVLLVASFGVYAVSGGLRYWLFAFSGEKIVASLRSQLFQALIFKDIAFFDDQQSGKLLSRLALDTEALQHTFSQELGLLMRYSFIVLGGIALLLFTSIELTLLLLLIVPLTAWFTGISGKFIRRYSADTQSALANASGLAEEALSSARIVRAYGRETFESSNYTNELHQGLAFVKRRVGVVALLEGGVNLAASLAVVAILWYGSGLVIENKISVGTLTSFLIYTFLVTSSLTGLANVWTDFTRAAGSADRVFQMINHTGGKSERNKTSVFNRGAIAFKNANFSYPTRPDSVIFDSLSFSIQDGECVALVGPSGEGKSTIAALLAGFYDVNGGGVFLGDVDIRDISNTSLRDNVSFVEQEPVLFSTTIRNNLLYGKLDASHEELINAIELANADEFIFKLPQGLDTCIGAKGVQLSGGQKQRIALARALLKRPKILILDEVTSALDTNNEQLIADAIRKIQPNKTVIIITHSDALISLADKVMSVSNNDVSIYSQEQYLNANGVVPHTGFLGAHL